MTAIREARGGELADGRRISIRGAFVFAWSAFKKRFGLFTSALLTMFGAWVALEIIVIAGQRFGILWWTAAHLTFLVFFAGLELGLVQVCLAVYNGVEPTFADVFAHLRCGPTFLVGQIIYLSMVIVGLALLVIPGIYLSARYALFGFCMADGRANVLQSFQQSEILTRGAQPLLLRMLFALLLLNLVGACLLGLGLLITIPVSGLMMAAVYKQLSVS